MWPKDGKHFILSEEELRANDVKIHVETTHPFARLEWEEDRDEAGNVVRACALPPCYFTLIPKT